MAKQIGPLLIKGKLDDLSFYDSVFGPLVRRKGGASREKIRKAANFARLREHHEEFRYFVKAAKLIRFGLFEFIKRAPDFRLIGRMNQLMNELKKLDDVGMRGKRRITVGLEKDQGKRLFENFDLNSQVKLDKILKIDPYIEGKQINLKGLVPKKHIKAPKEATHVVLKGILLKADFDTEKQEMESA